MKKATRLLILTAFVFPLFAVSRAYAGGPVPGQRIPFGERQHPGFHPTGVQGTDPLNPDFLTTDGFHETGGNPLHLDDPIGGPDPNIDRNDLWNRSVGDHDRFPGQGHPAWDPTDNGGGTAPIDGGISLLLAAGIGLGIKKARARKQTV